MIQETILEEKGMRDNTFVIIGGGVTTDFAGKEIGADARTLDPTEAMRHSLNLPAVGIALSRSIRHATPPLSLWVEAPVKRKS